MSASLPRLCFAMAQAREGFGVAVVVPEGFALASLVNDAERRVVEAFRESR